MSKSAREAARRREAVDLLRLAAVTVDYTLRELGNGLDPEQARVAAFEAAAELAVVSEELRRLTRLGPAERRTLAMRLLALGMSQREAAARLGVAERTVRSWVADRRAARGIQRR
ncbi:MAG: helix-turn-helix domain-containing protein [Streptosporangiaceae bacterium]